MPSPALWSVLLAALVCAEALPGLGSSFEPSRLRYIDTVQGAGGAANYLFRGDLPVENGTVPYSLINATLRAAAAKHNVTLPVDYFFSDLSLLQPLEFKDADVIKKFFKAFPQLGSYTNWITVGDLVHPDALPAKQRESKAKDLGKWQLDNLPKKMEELHTMLETAYPVPRVIYIHCEAGMDRTGEMSGSYYMRWLNWTFAEALNFDNSIETRNITVESRNSLQWYCYNLKYTTEPWRDCGLP